MAGHTTVVARYCTCPPVDSSFRAHLYCMGEVHQFEETTSGNRNILITMATEPQQQRKGKFGKFEPVAGKIRATEDPLNKRIISTQNPPIPFLGTRDNTISSTARIDLPQRSFGIHPPTLKNYRFPHHCPLVHTESMSWTKRTFLVFCSH